MHGGLQINSLALFFHFQHPDVLNLRLTGEIVLLHTGIDAFSAPNATTDVEGIAIHHPVQRLRIGNTRLDAIGRINLAFQSRKDRFFLVC